MRSRIGITTSGDSYREGLRGPDEKVPPLHGSSYVKRIPLTAPTVAVPTARIPFGFRLIPVGSGVPLESIPNVPPRGTSGGNVALRSKIAALPTISGGTAGTQAAGDDEDVRAVRVAEAAPTDADPYVSLPLSASAAIATARLRFKKLRRSLSCCTFSGQPALARRSCGVIEFSEFTLSGSNERGSHVQADFLA